MRICKNKLIFPLSCDPSLNKKKIPGIDAYYADLNGAFSNPRIRNIAVTGQHGVGKSSLLKSFDASRRFVFKRKPRFLYVSMGQYDERGSERTDSGSPPGDHAYTGKLTDGFEEFRIVLNAPENSDGDKTEADQTDEKNAIERRMLLQLCAKFGEAHFTSSSFRLIPRKPSVCRTLGFVAFAMAVLLLLMKAPLAALFVNWDPSIDWVKFIVDLLLAVHEYVEATLYVIALIGAAGILWKGCQWIGMRAKGSTMAIKTSNIEWNTGEDTCGDYLDHYTQELVYCLSSIGKKIDYTVVFEDMDRLSRELCLPIFMRLREINHILSANMKNGKYIRFIYVVRDDIVNALDYHKFFDFTLPVVATLNKGSAEAIWRDNLAKANDGIEKMLRQQCRRQKAKQLLGERTCDACSHEKCNSVKCFRKEMEGNGRIVQWAAEVLTDYRKMFTILNEYSLAVRLYFCGNGNKLTCRTAEQILAFYLYKHVWPEDYQLLIDNNVDASFLTGTPISGRYEELFLKIYQAGLLSIDSLNSAGFSRDRIAALWQKRLESGEDLPETIDALTCTEGYKYPELRKLVEERCKFNPDDHISEEALKRAIQFVMKEQATQESTHDWFFESRDSDICIGVIAELSETEGKAFVDRCKTAEKWNIFAKCKKIGEKLIHDNKWDEKKAKVYAWGVHPDNREGDDVVLENGTTVAFALYD